jgi:hypothetical protein
MEQHDGAEKNDSVFHEKRVLRKTHGGRAVAAILFIMLSTVEGVEVNLAQRKPDQEENTSADNKFRRPAAANEASPMRRCPLFFLSLVCVLLVVAGAAAAEPVDLSGNWHGTWKSCETGHHGPLNATFCKITDGCYQVRFTGRFFVVLPFRFTVPLAVTGQQDGMIGLSGSPQLPLFGTFHFYAVATDNEFTATYFSRRDRGQFNLCR